MQGVGRTTMIQRPHDTATMIQRPPPVGAWHMALVSSKV